MQRGSTSRTHSTLSSSTSYPNSLLSILLSLSLFLSILSRTHSLPYFSYVVRISSSSSSILSLPGHALRKTLRCDSQMLNASLSFLAYPLTLPLPFPFPLPLPPPLPTLASLVRNDTKGAYQFRRCCHYAHTFHHNLCHHHTTTTLHQPKDITCYQPLTRNAEICRLYTYHNNNNN